MTRRHRIHEAELGPVYEVITNELSYICREHPQDMVPYLKHLHLFRLWWRIKEGREGKPAYPNPVTYGTIKQHVVPASWSNGTVPSTRVPGQPQANGKSFDTTNLNPPVAGATINEEAS